MKNLAICLQKCKTNMEFYIFVFIGIGRRRAVLLALVLIICKHGPAVWGIPANGLARSCYLWRKLLVNE